MWNSLLNQIQLGNRKNLARCISLVENEVEGYETFMEQLPINSIPIIGITGPPGAGKSTLTDALINKYIEQQKKIAVLCIDPSSPFNLGALLGDRIRMSRWYTTENVYIRSLATRGSLGGLNPKVIEITDVLKASNFDVIIIETVGVGQSEIEIAGLADVTIVAIVPEAGDEIQTMKAGLMEIADIFVVNKADRAGSDTFVKNLQLMLAPSFSNHSYEVKVLKTIATKNDGITALIDTIEEVYQNKDYNKRAEWLLVERAWQLIQKNKMKGILKTDILEDIKAQQRILKFNLYSFIKNYNK
jgi:LAO/AO transport system kinase